MNQNDTKLYKLTRSLGKATIIMTSSTVTIHHCPIGKFNQRDVIPEEPSDSSTFPCRQVCGVARGGGGALQRRREKLMDKGMAMSLLFILSFGSCQRLISAHGDSVFCDLAVSSTKEENDKSSMHPLTKPFRWNQYECAHRPAFESKESV